jgi:hypothetical protein
VSEAISRPALTSRRIFVAESPDKAAASLMER